jgi:ferredoxin-NADP reductase
MLQPWRTGKVIRILDETATTRRFWIEVPEIENFDFNPGQFVTLDLPIHEKPNKRWRSYSIASWPDGSNVFELVIVLLEGGLGTAYLFNEVRVGSELTLRGPQGVFVLPETIDRDLYFICTGTGIAPFRAMTHHILNHQINHQNIYLVFGCRLFGDCLYGQELKALEKELPGLNYIPTFSREKEPGEHRSGYVHAVYEEIISHQMKKLNDHDSAVEASVLKPAYFYLCGWKNMIDEAKQRILSLGYDKKAIHLELYG